ncbi:MAG: hypothetical protein P8J33_01030 [Pirellulaceae bacterium]|nr:hypothetical protein [Pirellulaceae bacterium]
MNCFSHAYRFLDRDPHFIVGTCVPDWLSMVARKTRAREKFAAKFVDSAKFDLGQLAAGIVRHHQDDYWFHEKREFVETNLQFAIELRELLGADAGFRPHLAGHILIEMLLDAYLTEQDRSQLDDYYRKVESVDPSFVQKSINQMAGIPTDRIEAFLPRYLKEAYLYDYVDDQRTRYRLNRVLHSVKLAELPESFLEWLPTARERVYKLAPKMLTPPT